VKAKLDENLPHRLTTALAALGHDIDTVHAERLNGQTDPHVWSATQAAQRFFITQDLDFSDVRRYTPGSHQGLLLVRLARPGREALFERVVTVFQTENVEDWRGCLVVVTDRKVRVRRPVQPTRRGSA
jgi:predicted nuclease of predicted toxin-antitoxin system